MAKTYDTYQSSTAPGFDEYIRADTVESFAAMIAHMAYSSTAEFERVTGVPVADLLGKWFFYGHQDRVFLLPEADIAIIEQYAKPGWGDSDE